MSRTVYIKENPSIVLSDGQTYEFPDNSRCVIKLYNGLWYAITGLSSNMFTQPEHLVNALIEAKGKLANKENVYPKNKMYPLDSLSIKKLPIGTIVEENNGLVHVITGENTNVLLSSNCCTPKLIRLFRVVCLPDDGHITVDCTIKN